MVQGILMPLGCRPATMNKCNFFWYLWMHLKNAQKHVDMWKLTAFLPK